MQQGTCTYSPVAEVSLWPASTCTALRGSADATEQKKNRTAPSEYRDERIGAVADTHLRRQSHDNHPCDTHDLSLHSLIRPIFYTDAEEREEKGSQLLGEWYPPSISGVPPPLNTSLCSVLTCGGVSPSNCFGSAYRYRDISVQFDNVRPSPAPSSPALATPTWPSRRTPPASERWTRSAAACTTATATSTGCAVTRGTCR